MSRAFLSENQEDFQEDDIPELRYPLPPGVRNYMTPAGAEKTRAELSELTAQRNQLSGRVARLVAADTAERERLAADRRRVRELENRIAYLARMLENGEVVDPARQEKDRVLFGARVTVDRDDGNQNTYRIVGVDESDPNRGSISWLSPVAKALTSKRVGDTVNLTLPTGPVAMTIVRIEY